MQISIYYSPRGGFGDDPKWKYLAERYFTIGNVNEPYYFSGINHKLIIIKICHSIKNLSLIFKYIISISYIKKIYNNF